MRKVWALLLAISLCVGCGRYFPGPIRPMSEARQEPDLQVRDDGSVAYVFRRLEISLRPLTANELNRQFATYSTAGGESVNPYTYGDWKPMGDTWTPERFTVFELRVKNYAFPKMRVDSEQARLVAENGRQYEAMTFDALSGYYQAFAVAYAGNAYQRFREREDLLRRTLWSNEMLFSGQEEQGYVVFPPLHDDVTRFAITLPDIALRFDFRDLPVETVSLTCRFERDVYRGYQPPAALVVNR